VGQRCPATGKVTVGLASHWPCVADLSGLSTCGLTASPTLFMGYGTLPLPIGSVRCIGSVLRDIIENCVGCNTEKSLSIEKKLFVTQELLFISSFMQH